MKTHGRLPILFSILGLFLFVTACGSVAGIAMSDSVAPKKTVLSPANDRPTDEGLHGAHSLWASEAADIGL